MELPKNFVWDYHHHSLDWWQRDCRHQRVSIAPATGPNSPFIQPLNTMLRPITLIAALLLIPMLAFGQNCTSETDEFTGETDISCDNVEVTVNEQPLETIYGAWVMAVQAEGQNAMVLTVRAESWNFIDADQAYAIIDGERYQFRVVNGEREVDDGDVIEQKIIPLGGKDAQAIANAQKFRLKVGQAVFDASPVSSNFEMILNKY